jgi:hypothetical protein
LILSAFSSFLFQFTSFWFSLPHTGVNEVPILMSSNLKTLIKIVFFLYPPLHLILGNTIHKWVLNKCMIISQEQQNLFLNYELRKFYVSVPVPEGDVAFLDDEPESDVLVVAP